MHQSSSSLVEKVVLVFDESKSIKPYEWKGWEAYYISSDAYDENLASFLNEAKINNRITILVERHRVANGYEWRGLNGHALISYTETK